MADREFTPRLGLIGLDIADHFGYEEKIEFTEVMRANLHILDTNTVSATSASFELFVATNGEDANPGTSQRPLRTIQAALNLVPKLLRHPVTINVASGSYKGFYAAGYTVDQQVVDVSGAWLEIRGATAPFFPTTGPASGTLTSAVQGIAGLSTWGSVTDSTANWTIDNLKTKWVRIVTGPGAGQSRVIMSNTATRIDIVGAWTTVPTSASTYAIEEPATAINEVVNVPAGLGLAAGTPAHFLMWDVRGNAAFFRPPFIMNNFKFVVAGQTVLRPRTVEGLLYKNCWFSGSGNAVSNAESFTVIRMEDCYASPVSTGNFFSLLSPYVQALPLRTYIENCTRAHQISTLSWVDSTNCFYKNISGAVFELVGTQAAFVSRADRIDGNGIGVGYRSTFVGGVTSMSIQNGTALSCSIGVHLVSGKANISNLNGGANAVGIDISKGAQVSITPGVTMSGTVDLRVDGVDTSLAVLRASSPKVQKNTDYFTVIFE